MLSRAFRRVVCSGDMAGHLIEYHFRDKMSSFEPCTQHGIHNYAIHYPVEALRMLRKAGDLFGIWSLNEPPRGGLLRIFFRTDSIFATLYRPVVEAESDFGGFVREISGFQLFKIPSTFCPPPSIAPVLSSSTLTIGPLTFERPPRTGTGRLCGYFVGIYGPHGAEVVHVFEDGGGCIRGVKSTGDPYVHAGMV
jgi:hypothetical protein